MEGRNECFRCHIEPQSRYLIYGACGVNVCTIKMMKYDLRFKCFRSAVWRQAYSMGWRVHCFIVMPQPNGSSIRCIFLSSIVDNLKLHGINWYKYMRYKLNVLVSVNSLDWIMIIKNFLFSITSLTAVLLVGASDARGCDNGHMKGDCFDTTIESCNTGLSVTANCKTKFGDNVCSSSTCKDWYEHIVCMLRYRNMR